MQPVLLASDLRLLVFDLDGTLIDSQIDLVNSVNATLEAFHLQPLDHPTVATYIGDGAAMLIRRALAQAKGAPPEEDFASHALEYFLEYYRVHKLDFTYVYDGVFESLRALRSTLPDLPMAILTNKPFRPSRAICDALELSPFFFQNYGGDSFISKKPDPEGYFQIMKEASALTKTIISPMQTVMIGDSNVDIATARAAGARSIGCQYGLSPDSLIQAAPDALAATPFDWAPLLGVPLTIEAN
jgi:phosphoglycolate phosphatase